MAKASSLFNKLGGGAPLSGKPMQSLNAPSARKGAANVPQAGAHKPGQSGNAPKATKAQGGGGKASTVRPKV